LLKTLLGVGSGLGVGDNAFTLDEI